MRWVLLLFALSVSAWAKTPSLEAELERLETIQSSGKIKPQELSRLAELYFLTSRCPDVKKLKRLDSPVACVCGSKCSKSSEAFQLMKFRHTLAKSNGWGTPEVQAAWKKVRHMPEAQYWAIKYLGYRPQTLAIRNVRAELEKSLESLEVIPE